jgi:hypothetical protein
MNKFNSEGPQSPPPCKYRPLLGEIYADVSTGYILLSSVRGCGRRSNSEYLGEIVDPLGRPGIAEPKKGG